MGQKRGCRAVLGELTKKKLPRAATLGKKDLWRLNRANLEDQWDIQLSEARGCFVNNETSSMDIIRAFIAYFDKAIILTHPLLNHLEWKLIKILNVSTKIESYFM